MNAIEARYHRAIKRIGGALALLTLPESIKDLLKNATDLQTKTRLLEEIATVIETKKR